MTRFVLIRHGEPSPLGRMLDDAGGVDPADKPILSQNGQTQAVDIGAQLVDGGFIPPGLKEQTIYIASSPYERTKETGESILAALKNSTGLPLIMQVAPWLTLSATTTVDLQRNIPPQTELAVLVTHEPNIYDVLREAFTRHGAGSPAAGMIALGYGETFVVDAADHAMSQPRLVANLKPLNP